MTEMFAQHLHYTSIWRKMIVTRKNVFHRSAILNLEDCPQATISPRRKGCKFRNKSTGLVEYFIRLITTHPVLKDFQVLGVRFNVCYWYLVGTEGAFDGNAVYYFRSSPSFRGAEDNSRPGGSLREAMLTGIFLIRANFRIASV